MKKKYALKIIKVFYKNIGFYTILFGLFLFTPNNLFAQQNYEFIKGNVKGADEHEHYVPLVGANVYWADTQIGEITDEKGNFRISNLNNYKLLVISFIGYVNDTLNVEGKSEISVKLNSSIELNDVNIVYRKKSSETDFINPISVTNIGEKELHKAACCNLSESFETSPAVDVSFTDAVTGTKQIMMLGLAGKYTQITRENMPDIRGFSSISGLTYIPGTWVEQIQLIKGTGSVLNGYESLAGQINVELRKPDKMEKLYINAYVNENGRIETNAHIKFDVSEHLKSALLIHASKNSVKYDRNNDGFLDNPLTNQFVILNRWELLNDYGIHAEAGAKATYIDNIGGQKDFNLNTNENITDIWGMHLIMRRIEAWTKIGKVSSEKPYQSIALQLSGSLHNQNSFFGLNNYDASQNSFYANFIYQSILGNTNNKFKTGLSFQFDDFKEEFNLVNYNRIENVPGVFFEYTFNYTEKFNLVAGLRADYHNIFGVFVTPRLHIRYALSEKDILRFSFGRAQRTTNIFSENNALMASSREFVILVEDDKKPYGLDVETAWNYGINYTKYFKINRREAIITFDFYRTDFVNQVVLDLDQNPQQAIFYNLKGKSYSNSFQTQLDYELFERFDLRLAYRWYDVKVDYNGKLLEKPLVSEHRTFFNIAYETKNKWKFDYTFNLQGSKRIPNTSSNPVEYRLDEKSPRFNTMNAQISKSWKNRFDIYLGVENLLDFTQKNPIIASNQAFSPYFDSSLIWGPIFGRSFYLGIRFKIL
ncbi:MAG: TonB-dependent receptor [Bacteroidales bacterium]|nr:TonB-dependent receptor [Bacteroidales bacterium]MBN2757281.1 TonB-dependent receptor [Bacteroidales bacterium]